MRSWASSGSPAAIWPGREPELLIRVAAGLTRSICVINRGPWQHRTAALPELPNGATAWDFRLCHMLSPWPDAGGDRREGGI